MLFTQRLRVIILLWATRLDEIDFNSYEAEAYAFRTGMHLLQRLILEAMSKVATQAIGQ